MNLLSSRQLAEVQGVVPCCPAGNLLKSKVLFSAVQHGVLTNLLSSRQLADKQGAVPCCPAGSVDESAVQQATFISIVYSK